MMVGIVCFAISQHKSLQRLQATHHKKGIADTGVNDIGTERLIDSSVTYVSYPGQIFCELDISGYISTA